MFGSGARAVRRARRQYEAAHLAGMIADNQRWLDEDEAKRKRGCPLCEEKFGDAHAGAAAASSS